MRRYGQFCPVSKAAEVFAERWTPLVLLCGSHRELARAFPGWLKLSLFAHV